MGSNPTEGTLEYNISNMDNEPMSMEVLSEKQKKWDQVRAEVDMIVDGLGLGIDEGIKEEVTAFMVNGFTTSMSCEGHVDEANEHGDPYPWIEVNASEPEGWEEAEGDVREEMNRLWRRENLEQQRKMLDCFSEFYATRSNTPVERRLTFSRVGAFGAFKVQSMGAEVSELYPQEERRVRMEEYRGEMRDFGEFMKKRFLGEEFVS